MRFSFIGRVPRLIAGVDASFIKKNDQDYILTVIVVLSFPELEIVEKKYLTNKVNFPYIPGLLSFREGPSFIKTWKRLNCEPELVFFDGQGIAHPRGLGLASHMGLWIDRPTIGVAKSRLYGVEEALPKKKNEWNYLRAPGKDGEIIGAVLQTKEGTNPLYISPGNLITLDDSIRLTLSCTGSYRLPEPTRIAHSLTQSIKKEKANK